MTGSGLCGYDIINKGSMDGGQVLKLNVCVLVDESETQSEGESESEQYSTVV